MLFRSVVRVVASTVNPTDLMMRSGQQAALMTSLTPPYIAGLLICCLAKFFQDGFLLDMSISCGGIRSLGETEAKLGR